MRYAIVFNSLAFFSGLMLFSVGAWLVYPPAAFIGSGLILMFVSLFGREIK